MNDKANPEQRHRSFACPHCGQAGEIVWQGGNGGEHKLVRLSAGFHIEEGRLPGVRQVIVCSRCDEIDPPRLLKS